MSSREHGEQDINWPRARQSRLWQQGQRCSQVGGGGEVGAVADIDEDAGSENPGEDPRHQRQGLGKGMSFQKFMDPGGKKSALLEDCGQRCSKAGDYECVRLGPGATTDFPSSVVMMSSTTLSAMRRAFVASTRLRTSGSAVRSPTALWVRQGDARAEDTFRVGEDLSQQAAESIADAGGPRPPGHRLSQRSSPVQRWPPLRVGRAQP